MPVRFFLMRKVFFCFLFVGFALQVSAQNYQLHAVYMYQFIKYIKWPDSESGTDFVIGVLGQTPALEHLEKMAKVKKAGDRTIVVKKFSTTDQVTPTNMLFVGKGTINEVKAVLPKIKGTSTLLITEEEGFGLEGSNINFVERNGRLAFELNQDAMDREKLKVSGELAKLAIVL